MPEEMDPVLVKIIETSVKLDQALRELQDIRQKQEINHAVSISLREHKTIERVDTLWDNMRQLNGSLLVIRVFLIALGVAIPFLMLTHYLWQWPA